MRPLLSTPNKRICARFNLQKTRNVRICVLKVMVSLSLCAAEVQINTNFWGLDSAAHPKAKVMVYFQRNESKNVKTNPLVSGLDLKGSYSGLDINCFALQLRLDVSHKC